MNLLSIGAAYGVIVAVFQWGWGKGLFGVEETRADRVVPADDAVRHPVRAVDGLRGVPAVPGPRGVPARQATTTAAVIEGISATARVITSAALIMISVFAAFVLGDDPTIKMFGLGLATAVFIDATIVRVVLVPATMRLLGDRNWWLPGLARPAACPTSTSRAASACPSPSTSPAPPSPRTSHASPPSRRRARGAAAGETPPNPGGDPRATVRDTVELGCHRFRSMIVARILGSVAPAGVGARQRATRWDRRAGCRHDVALSHRRCRWRPCRWSASGHPTRAQRKDQADEDHSVRRQRPDRTAPHPTGARRRP